MKPKHPQKTQTKDNRPQKPTSKNIFLYGRHACLAALNNGNRKILRIFLTKNFDAGTLPKINVKPQLITNDEVGKYIPEGSVHQGIIVETMPLPDYGLDYVIKKGGIIVVLDQVTDPQNV